MSYTIYGTDVNRFFAIIDIDVLSTYKNIIGVVDSTYDAIVYLIFNGNITNYGSATWTAYRRYDDKPDNPWGSGTFGNAYYLDAYDITLVNCPQTLTGPYTGGANIVGTSQSDLYSKARNYFDNPYGQGTITLFIKSPGQILNFTSRLLGSTARQYINSDSTINIQPLAISVLKEGGSWTFNYSPNGSVCYTFTNTQLQNLVKLYINKIHSIVSSNFDTYLNQGSRAFSQSFGEDAYMTNCLPRKATEEMTTLQIWDSRNSGTVDINSTIILFSDAECTRVTKKGMYTGTTPTLVSSVQLPAGKYALFGSTEAPRIDVSGTEIRDSNNNIICKRCSKSYPPNTPAYVQAVGLVELAEDTTISLYAYGSSTYNDEQNDIFALKINSAGTIVTKNFSGTSSTSYENIETLKLSAGKYLVVSEITFGTADIAYAQKVTTGSDIIIYDTGLGGNPAPISSSMSYIDLLESKTLTLSVKTSSNGVSISGYIKAMRIA